MESSYLTVDFFRKLPQEVVNPGNPGHPGTPVSTKMDRGNPAASRGERGGVTPSAINVDRYAEGHFRRIGSNVSSYVNMVSETLRLTIPKAVVYCQVKEAKQSLLNYFYTQIGKKEVCSGFTLPIFKFIFSEEHFQSACMYVRNVCFWVHHWLVFPYNLSDKLRCFFVTIMTNYNT